jgi:hypothetical protein
MDPLTAISLASSVVQFVDFSTKLVSSAHSLYLSTSGAKAEHLELEDLARSLQQQADEATPQNISNNAALSKQDQTLVSLGNSCRAVADELLSALDKLKLKGGSFRGLKSIYIALKGVLEEEKIASIQQRLDRVGKIMNSQIIFNLQSRMLEILDRLETKNRSLESTRERDIIDLKEDIKRQFEQIKEGQELQEGAVSRALDQLTISMKKSKEYSAEQRILGALRYDDMNYRRVTLRSAHDKTFSWMFSSTATTNGDHFPSKFEDWLTSNDTVFWISGRIGSGKSTLMKYICDHEFVRSNLKKWSEGNRLVITNFFFWNASKNDLPKTKEGLMRSILYQILRQAPDLIQYVTPGEWENFVSSDLGCDELGLNFLTTPELLATFERITAMLATTKIKLVFFIDGLDEYDGKPEDIIPLIISLKKASTYIKMCVSSRRWNQFETEFGQDNSRKLYIEAFTKKDIELYVRETLGRDSGYQGMMEDEDSPIDLVQEIVSEYFQSK